MDLYYFRIFNRFLHNFSGHNTPINAVAMNDDGVLISCGDNGSMNFWDYETGYCFQKTSTIPQPGIVIFTTHVCISLPIASPRVARRRDRYICCSF